MGVGECVGCVLRVFEGFLGEVHDIGFNKFIPALVINATIKIICISIILKLLKGFHFSGKTIIGILADLL